jgi:endonuclease YncB( thermonuclease family)
MIIKTLRKTPDIHPLDHIRVIDGDTIEATIRLPFDTAIVKRVRLRGWWAPEPVGPWRIDGLQAAERLRAFCEGKALWLHAPSCRLDRYGRVLGHLMHGERIINPKDILLELQLTETEHKRRRDEAIKAKQLPESNEP